MALRNVARALLCLSTASIAAIGTVAVAAPSYAASGDAISPSSSAYTDQAAPTKSLSTAYGAKVGTFTASDGAHTSRAYYTFNLAGLKGADVFSASLGISEASANNCSVDRQIQIWTTATPAKKITWNSAPAEQRLVYSGSPTGACPGDYDIDFADAVRRAIAGTGVVTFEVREAAAIENDAAYGRVLDGFALTIDYNIPPDAPIYLTANNLTCVDTAIWVNSTTPSMGAYLVDRDGSADTLTATFEVWPSGHPELAVDTTVAAGSSPTPAFATADGPLADKGHYIMKVKANDGQADSAWSAPCRFNVDATAPRKAPAVTMPVYPADGQPHGGLGVGSDLHLDARGDKDIIGFALYRDGDEYESLGTDVPGGTADDSFTPYHNGLNELTVRGYDKAGNLGPATVYQFLVTDTSPLITDHDPDALMDAPRHITVTPRQPGAVSYEYMVNGSYYESDTPDFTIVGYSDYLVLEVWSVDADGNQSDHATYTVHYDTTPIVTSSDYPSDGQPHGGVGVAGTFTFAPHIADTVSYTYTFDDGGYNSVDAGTDGTASISYTPQTPGLHWVDVAEVAGGTQWYSTRYYFVVVG